MSKPTTTQGPGRPRIYESSTEKVEAFRRRLQSAGFMRKEVLVTAETWDQVQALAKEHGFSAVDVASGLLEHGLANYPRPRRRSLADKQFKQLGELSASALDPLARALKPDRATSQQHKTAVAPQNPIERFLAKRRESTK